jgi:hypothetical protein
MCSLPNTDKVRLCASVFGASIFERNHITFSPETENIEPDCQRRLVKIHTPVFAPLVRIVGRMVFNPHKLYDEWVIGCEGTPEKGPRVTFYVARGTHHNTIFVFTEASDDKRLSVYSFFNNVSVIKEMASTSTAEDLPPDLK